VQSLWRVACVRIPRFPIGAVWREERVLPAELNKSLCKVSSETHPSAHPNPFLQSLPTLPNRPSPTDTQLMLPLSENTGTIPPGKKGADVREWPSPATGARRVAERPGSFSATANTLRPARDTSANNALPNPTRTNTPSNPTGNRNGASRDGNRVRPSMGMPDPVLLEHWDNIPRALAEGESIRVVSAAAGRMGVRAGMSVPEARVYCATLEVREWDSRAVTDAVMAVTGQLLQCSPQVTAASGAPGTWWVGASGFDNVGGEEALSEQLLRIARVWHPEARVAIADSCVTARAAVWAPQTLPKQTQTLAKQTQTLAGQTHMLPGQLHTCTVVPVGGCREYLAPAPLGLVPMTEEVREALQSLGLRTAGALSALAPGDVERRWGAEGLSAWRLAHGDDPRRPGLVRVENPRSASAELASATDNMAPLLFLIRSALNRLVQQLLQDGRAAASVAITLSLDARPQHTITREIRPARPLARVAPLFDQCRALLEKWTLEAPVYAVTVSIPATAPLTADQGDLLVPSWRDAAATVDAVFVRLRAALEVNGVNDVVVHPTLGNAHRPELAGQWQSADALRLAELGSARDLRRARKTADGPALVATDATNPIGNIDNEHSKNNNDCHHADNATGSESGHENETENENGINHKRAGNKGNEIRYDRVSDISNRPRYSHNNHSETIRGNNSSTHSSNNDNSRNNNNQNSLNTNSSSNIQNAALRLLEKPEQVAVQSMNSEPRVVNWRDRRLQFVSTHGPERLSGDWWRADGFARDYWRCTVAGEGDLLMYRDAAGWFLQGWYD